MKLTPQHGLVKSFSQIKPNDLRQVGGKGLSLATLKNAGFRIPDGFVITTEAFTKYSKKRIPETEIRKILKAFDELKVKRVAVRSSAIAEDAAGSSWAGQLESYLNVSRDDIVKRVYDCWLSMSSIRAKAYAQKNLVDEHDLAVAVVVQKMAVPEISGVMFTVNPVSANRDEMLIESSFGLGEMIVQGEITPDSYVVSVDKNIFKIKTKVINYQDKLLVYVGGSNREMQLPQKIGGLPSITDDKLLELAKVGKKIEKFYGTPQDIEWVIEGGKIYVVQSRGITTLGSTTPRSSGDHPAPIITGLPGSEGIVTGRVKIIKKPEQAGSLKDGEILVTAKTSPDFITAFGKMTGIVTDGGGITSHAAVIARELGLPAVVGTKNATSFLKDGQMITVNGNDGVVYEGSLDIARTAHEVGVGRVIKKSGDEIKDLINSLTNSVNDVSELWPLKPGQIIPYIDLDLSLDIYSKLKELIEVKKMPIHQIAKLFERPSKIRFYIINSAVTGLKAAHMLKIGNVTSKDQIKLIGWCIKILKSLTVSDPLCLKGGNLVFDRMQTTAYINKTKWTETDHGLKKAINLLNVNLVGLIWAFYWDYFADGGYENYGPYGTKKFGPNAQLLIRDYSDVGPEEVWPLAKRVPYKSIVLSQIYDKGGLSLNFGNRLVNKENISVHNTYFNLKVDGKNIDRADDIRAITRELEKVTKAQVKFVNELSDLDKVRYGAKLSYYSLRKFFGYFSNNWYPEKTIEETIQILGKKFIKEGKVEKDRGIEFKRKLYNPRNYFLP